MSVMLTFFLFGTKCVLVNDVFELKIKNQFINNKLLN